MKGPCPVHPHYHLSDSGLCWFGWHYPLKEASCKTPKPAPAAGRKLTKKTGGAASAAAALSVEGEG